LDGRLLTLFSSLYGIESGARFETLVPWPQAVLHPNVVGATPGLEGLDIAWDAQGDLEDALAKGLARVLSSYDYSKFFDSFDYEWTKNFLLFHGMPKNLVALTHALYTNLERGVKRRESLSKIFDVFNGYGQRDVMTLVPALLLVSMQFYAAKIKFHQCVRVPIWMIAISGEH